MDQLLEKIARSGKESLTDDERRSWSASAPASGTCRSRFKFQVPSAEVGNGGTLGSGNWYGVRVATLITPRTLSGFRDYLARRDARAREVSADCPRSLPLVRLHPHRHARPAKSLDVLLGKGGDESDKLVYRVRSARSEKEEMGLRFDLTVPFARFSAQYINQLGTPFKRYAMGPVWRGERPGRAATASSGSATSTPSAPPPTPPTSRRHWSSTTCSPRLGFDKFEVRINNRMLLNGLLELMRTRGQGRATAPLARQAAEDRPRQGRRGDGEGSGRCTASRPTRC